MRLIDADALTERYGDWYTEEGTEEGYIGTIKGIVESMPTIEERKKGKWIWDGGSRREYPYKCSECGEIDYYAFLYDAETRTYKQQDNFCPNCGADMRGNDE